MIDGLDAYLDQLTRLPTDLRDDAAPLVDQAARDTEAAARVAYPSRTGNLRNGLYTSRARTAYGVTATVGNRAKHARIFEIGSQARHTAIGANRGSMPAGNILIPIAVRNRSRMVEAVATMVETYGFTVTTNG